MSMVINGTSGITFPDGSLQGIGVGRRNLIINGAMQVAQRGTSASGITGGYFTCDRWIVGVAASSVVYSQSREQDAPAGTGLNYSLKTEVTTADTSLDADQRTSLNYYIEGYDSQQLNWGTSDGRDATLSFWVKSSETGTYGLAVLTQNGTGRSRSFTYTVDAANTWEKKTINIPADTATFSDWFQTTAIGVQIRWSFGCGSNRTEATGSWTAGGTTFGATGEKNLAAISGATFYLTGVQLELGSVATPFEHRSYGEELQLCQRYFQKSYNDGTAVGTATTNGNVLWFTSQQWGVTSVPTGPISQGYVTLPVELRTTATVVPYSTTTGTANRFVLGSTGSDVTPAAWLQQAPSTIHIGYPQNAGGGGFSNTDSVRFHWTADAEL